MTESWACATFRHRLRTILGIWQSLDSRAVPASTGTICVTHEFHVSIGPYGLVRARMGIISYELVWASYRPLVGPRQSRMTVRTECSEAWPSPKVARICTLLNPKGILMTTWPKHPINTCRPPVSIWPRWFRMHFLRATGPNGFPSPTDLGPPVYVTETSAYMT